jgi:hypothetical protein
MFSQNHKNFNQYMKKHKLYDFPQNHKKSIIDGKYAIIIDFNFHRKNEFNYNTRKERQVLLFQQNHKN